MSTPNWAEILEAIGSLVVAVLAIWGDQVRAWLFGPKLELSLAHDVPDLTNRNDGKKALFYHLRITNHGHTLAEAVTVRCTSIWRKAADGKYRSEQLLYPVLLRWTPAELGRVLVSVRTSDVCDLGSLVENEARFEIAALVRPNNFRGSVAGNESIVVGIEAIGKNVTSKPYFVEISWDGVWSPNINEMAAQHLVVRPANRRDIASL